jgi:hypothetical protein
MSIKPFLDDLLAMQREFEAMDRQLSIATKEAKRQTMKK